MTHPPGKETWALRKRAQGDVTKVRFDLGGPAEGLHTDLPRLAAGQVGAQFWSVYVPARLAGASADGNGAVAAVLEQIDVARPLIARYPEALGLALTADDVERVFASGRVASLLGAEGGHAIAGSLGVLRMLYALGVRYLTLTHNANTGWAVGTGFNSPTSSILKTTNGGSSFGVQTSNTSKNLRSVWAVDEQLAYACGDSVEVWRTEDGGSTWEKIHHGKPIGGPGTGTTIIDHGTFFSIHAVANKVMAVGRDGSVIASHNRGDNWSAKRLTPQKKLRAGWKVPSPLPRKTLMVLS